MPTFFRLALICGLLGALASCARPPYRPTPAAVPPPASQAPTPAAAASGPEAALAAAERALAAGDIRRAQAALATLSPAALDFAGRLRYDTAQAEILLAQDQPQAALQALPRHWQVTEPALAARVERVRGEAYFRVGDPLNAVRTLTDRERLLTDPAQLAENRELLWRLLATADLDGIGLRFAQADAATQGWIELARIGRSVWLDYRNLEAALEEWHARFPGHPAADRIPSLRFQFKPIEEYRRAQLNEVALLLPLTGPFAAAAEAVRDGFMAAYFRAPEPRPQVRVYDGGVADETLIDGYRHAVSDGADFVLGPLRKEGVAALAGLGSPPVPVLALNYLDPGAVAPRDLYQWGLAPEDEARQVADIAASEGLLRAVALVPETEWGARVRNAFAQRLHELGGHLADARDFAPDARDFGQPITGVLALDASRERHRALSNLLGAELKFEPRRREDVDFVFVAARAEQARLILPQLRFHRATGLPVYATAAVYDGGAPDEELNGLRFCDMPWMLGGNERLAAARAELEALFPARGKEYSRLLALGYDAYTVAALIHGGQLAAGSYFPAATGTLSMQDDGAIRRGLGCAQVVRGGLEPLVPELPGEPAAQ
ncbi:MAG: penicillin-binding protein activator [Gammaproteobacteria bacterium]|nr:penicillin-binding protein activator [Gammaproteobacteria bacterium]